MAIKPRQFQEGIVLKEKTTSLDTEGQLANKDSKIKAYTDGAEREVVTNDQTQTLTNKDIDADNNTISNIETDNLKAGVLNTDLSGAATDTEIPSALAVKTALEGQNEASEVEYDPTLNPETSATNVQDALDDTGIASQAAQDAADAAQTSIDNHIADATDAHDATAISYDNATSGLTATEVQAAIDEVEGRLDTAETNISTNATGLSDHLADPTDAHDASAISYDNATSGLIATDTQAAIDEVDGNLDTHVAATSAHGVSGDIVGTTDAQTLSNKSIQDPTRLDVKKDTLANLETYALTATNGQFVFATDTKQMLQIVDNALVPVGSGSGGGIDVFFTERFEETVAADLSSGNNATFLGGGSLAGSLANDESTPIAGDRSITYTQASGSANDYVALPNIELALKEQDNVCGLKVYTIYDGNDNEIDFVVWDVTNSVELARVPIKASTKALEHQAIFETADDTANITCGFQVVLENSGAVLEFDEIEAKVNPFETTDIYASSEPVEYTPTLSAGWGTPSKNKAFWHQEGKFLVVSGTITTGTVQGIVSSIGLPNGLNIDADSLSENNTTSQAGNIVGEIAGNGYADHVNKIVAAPSTSTSEVYVGSQYSGTAIINPVNVTAVYTNSETVTYRFKVPIAGWTNTKKSVTVKNTTSSDIASENVFSAKVSSTGVVSDENITGWLDGDASISSTSRYSLTFASGAFSVAPVVMVMSKGVTATEQWVRVPATTSGFTVQTTNSSGTEAATDFDIMVFRSGADFVKERDRVYTFAADSLTGNSVSLVGNDGRSITANTESVPFNGSGLGWTSGADGSTTTNGNYYEVQKNNSIVDISIGVEYSPSDNSRIQLYVNGSLYRVLSPSLNTTITNGRYRSKRGEFSSGDKISFSLTAGVTLTTSTSTNYLNISEEYGDRGTFVGKFGYETAYIKDVKPSGTDGGTFTSGAWQTRDLNDLSGDTSFVSLSSNQFTLEAGVYDIEVFSPVFSSANTIGAHKARLRNITDGTDSIIGTAENLNMGQSNTQTTGGSKIEGRLILSESKIFEIQHRCDATQNTTGFGAANYFGVDEVYTQVKIVKKR